MMASACLSSGSKTPPAIIRARPFTSSGATSWSKAYEGADLSPLAPFTLLVWVLQLVADPTQDDVWLAYAEFAFSHRSTIQADWLAAKEAG